MSDEYDFGFITTPINGKGVKVTVNQFRNQWYVHLREYIEDPDEEIWFPTQKGIAIKAEDVDTVAEMFKDAGKLLTAIYRGNVEKLIDNGQQLSLFNEEND